VPAHRRETLLGVAITQIVERAKNRTGVVASSLTLVGAVLAAPTARMISP